MLRAVILGGTAVPEQSSRLGLLQMVNGFQASQALHVAAVLGIADKLSDGPRSSDDVADEVGADPRTAYRLMRALAAIGVLREERDRIFSLTNVGEYLRSDVPGSLSAWTIFIGQESNWNAWGNLLLGVKTGENVFPQVHGTTVWKYRADRPELSAIFNRSTEATKGGASILEIYDFSAAGVIVDVGGGNGSLLAQILFAYPNARGVLFDQPHVVRPDRLEAAQVADRCKVVGGSFFDAVPTGGDVYIMRAVIHDWDDEKSLAILRQCRKAMSGSAKLLLNERVVGPPNEDAGTKFSDLNMLVNPGGMERSREEYAALLEAAGFRLSRATPRASDLFSVIEATPV
jgi:hypothetical protein